jgi:hypothetical protein
MKQQYRHTKADEPIDRPVKKRGGKDKPFRIVSDGMPWLKNNCRNDWDKCKPGSLLHDFLVKKEVTLGRYETRARAEQALPALVRRGWDNCTILES